MDQSKLNQKGGSRYLVTFIDDFSRYVTVYFPRNKNEVLSKFQEYVSVMENRSGQKLRILHTIRSDNGGEYTSNEFKA